MRWPRCRVCFRKSMRKLLPRELLDEEMEHVSQLRKLIGCPIDWSDVPDVADRPSLLCDLLVYWADVAKEFQADMEMEWYCRFKVEEGIAYYGDAFTEKIVKPIQFNTEIWRSRAEAEYQKRVGFLRRLRFVGWDVYDKHKPPSGKSRSAIISTTKASEGASLFFRNDVISECNALMWHVIAGELLRVVELRPAHLFVMTDDQLGACNGHAVNTMRIDIDYFNAQAHGHPRPIPPGETLAKKASKQHFWQSHDHTDPIYNLDCPRIKDYELFSDWLCSKLVS